MPSLFCHHCLIKANKIFKTQPSLTFGTTQLVPSNPVNSLLILLKPHQNFAIALGMSSYKPLGSLKTLIAYVGTTWATAFIEISLPPLENILCCQLLILLSTLSLTSLKKLVLFLPIIDGRPKYFLYLETTFKLKMFFIVVIYPSDILPLKNFDDLSKLKICF